MKKIKLYKGLIIKLSIPILLLLLIILTCIFYKKNANFRIILDKYLFRKEIYENNLPYIEIDSSKVIGMYAYSRYICILQSNKLELYNVYGKKEETIEIEITSPEFESNGNYLIIAEKNGQKLYFINGKNVIWQKEIEGKIKDINVNKNGYVSVIISGTSYKTVIKTFDPEGNELFTTYLANTNAVATDISNDNKYLAIAEVNFSGIVVQSTVKVISIEEAKNNTANSIKNTYIANSGDLIINLKYQNKDNLICMYDEHIDILNDQNSTELTSFKDKNALFADIDLKSKIIKIIKTESGLLSTETEMQIMDNNAKITTYQIENIPKAVIVKDNMIAINLGTSALFIKDNGWLQKKYESSHEIQKIICSGEIAGIVSKNKIELISL